MITRELRAAFDRIIDSWPRERQERAIRVLVDMEEFYALEGDASTE